MWNQLKSLAKNSAIYGLGNIANSVLSFLLVPFYTHHLSTDDFGVYSLLMTVFTVLSLLADAGFTNSLSRYYFDEKMQNATPAELSLHRQKLLFTSLAATTLISIGIASLCGLFAEPLSRWVLQDPSYAPLLRLMAAALLFRGLTTVPLIYLRVTEQPIAYTILTAIQLLLFLLGNIILLWLWPLGIRGVLLSLMGSMAFYALTLLWAVRADLRPRFDAALLKELLRFGLPFLPVLLLMWVVDFADRWLLIQMGVTKDAIGVYSLGYKFGQAMMLVVTAFTMGWVPIRFKIMALGEAKVIYGRVATFYIAGAGSAWLILTAYATEIVHLTSTPQYNGAIAFVGPVGMAYLIYGLFVLAVTGLGVAKNSTAIPFVSLAAAVVNVCCNLLLIPRFGAIAAAYATIASYVVLTAGSLYFSQKLFRIDYEYRKCAVLLAGMLLIAWGASPLNNLPVGAAAAAKLLILPAYGVLIAVSGLLQRHEWGSVLRLASRFAPGALRPRLRGLADALSTTSIAEAPAS